MTKDEYLLQRVALRKWASPDSAGTASLSWRQSVEIARAINPNTPAFTLEFGSELVTTTVSGERFIKHIPIISTDEVDGVSVESNSTTLGYTPKTRYNVGLHLSTGITVGAAPTNKMIGKFRVPCGIVLITAGADTGKTPMAHALAGACGSDYSRIAYGEPLAGYYANEADGAAALAASMFNYTDIVFDSVKDLLALASGGAMKSGISRGALPFLSRLGSMAAGMGCTLYVPLNPSSGDDEVVQLLYEATKSNATCSITSSSSNSWSYVTRQGEGLQRQSGNFNVSYDKEGSMQIDRFTGSTDDAVSTERGGATISTNLFDRAVRRSVMTK